MKSPLERAGIIGLLLLAAIGAAACSDDARGFSGGDADIDTDTDADTDADGDTDTEDSCRLVDVVISIDASSSMWEEHAALRDDVFPAFAEHLDDISQGLDNFRVATLDACPMPANFHTRGNAGECMFDGGEVWIDSESPSMNEEFACVGDLYMGDVNCTGANDDEQPVTAALQALNPPYSENENAGFLRDDALLVVIAITDEDEQPTVGNAFTAQEIFDALAAVKGGDPERLVFLGIGGSTICTGLYGNVDYPATKLKEITDLFSAIDRGIWWDLCASQPMEDGLDAAFAIIEQACDEFEVE